jgi:hypothetical protein
VTILRKGKEDLMIPAREVRFNFVVAVGWSTWSRLDAASTTRSASP